MMALPRRMVVVPPVTIPIILLTLTIITSHAVADAARSSSRSNNDPNGLCSSPSGNVRYTGYKSTLDCRGYVYCHDGHLMGGGGGGGGEGDAGVIPCWPNQLFDEASGVCADWRDVDVGGGNCPLFDGSKMMPDRYDTGNANPQRFFVSVLLQSTIYIVDICECAIIFQ